MRSRHLYQTIDKKNQWFKEHQDEIGKIIRRRSLCMITFAFEDLQRFLAKVSVISSGHHNFNNLSNFNHTFYCF